MLNGIAPYGFIVLSRRGALFRARRHNATSIAIEALVLGGPERVRARCVEQQHNATTCSRLLLRLPARAL
jgi:hypothetical protein